MLDIIKKHRFIAILRNVLLEKAEKTVKALYDGGIRIFEVTFNPSKSDTIETVTKTFDLIKSLEMMFHFVQAQLCVKILSVRQRRQV